MVRVKYQMQDWWTGPSGDYTRPQRSAKVQYQSRTPHEYSLQSMMRRNVPPVTATGSYLDDRTFEY